MSFLGPCKTRHGSSLEECDPSGYYKPRYCRNQGQRRIRCACVRPMDGTVIAGSEVTFTDQGDEMRNDEMKPKCTDKGKNDAIILSYKKVPILILPLSIFFIKSYQD